MDIRSKLLCVLLCGAALTGAAMAQRGYASKGYNSRPIPSGNRHPTSTATHIRSGKKGVHDGAHEGRSRVAHVARVQPVRPLSTGPMGYASASGPTSGSGRSVGSQLSKGPAIKGGLNMAVPHSGLRGVRPRRSQAPVDNTGSPSSSDHKLQSELLRSGGAQRNSGGTIPRTSSAHGANTGKRPSGYHPGGGNRSSGHH
jgi:hypothetical protein